jgi:hypothetical protein
MQVRTADPAGLDFDFYRARADCRFGRIHELKESVAALHFFDRFHFFTSCLLSNSPLNERGVTMRRPP